MQTIRFRVRAAGLGVLGIVMQLAVSVSADAATLELLPGSAAPGAEILVRGEDYGAGQRVEIRLIANSEGSQYVLGTIDADESGALYDRRIVPDAPVGDYRVQALGLRDSLLATAVFEVSAPPALRIFPDSGPPGTEVSVEFGPVPAGSVEVRYDGVAVLGPIAHAGGSFTRRFPVPADRPDPLGTAVAVEAVARAGGSISGVAETTFTSAPDDASPVELATFSGPGEPLSPGQAFAFSGKLAVPANHNPADYELTLVMRSLDGDLIPVNTRPIDIDSAGNFSGEGVAPSLVSGSPLARFGETTDLGLVFKGPDASGSGFLLAIQVVYADFEVQTIKFNVRDVDGNPVEGAVVNVFANTLFVPPGYSFQEHGIPGLNSGSGSTSSAAAAAGSTTARVDERVRVATGHVWPGATSARGAASTKQDKSTWSALYASPNQYQDAIQQVKQSIAQTTNEVTGCPVTLNSGLTDANGDFEVNVVPFLNYLLDKGAQSVSQLDINTRVNGPGKATFSVKLGAVHLGLGLATRGGKCTGQRWDFQYDYDTELWKLRDGLDGDFTIPFNPDVTQVAELPDCGDAEIGIPAKPYMPGLPAKEISLLGQKIRRFGAVWSFAETSGASLLVDKVAQFRLPHLPSVFGLLENATMFLDNVEVGELTAEGALCGQDGVDYVIDLPGLHTATPGMVTGRVEATMLDGSPVTEFFQLDIRQGPTWINGAAAYDTRTILWRPDKVTLVGVEPVRSQHEMESGIPWGVGDLENDNIATGTVRQVLLPTGGGSRIREGGASSTAASQTTDSVDNETGGGITPVAIGDPTPITVLDTGKIPLFRYVWGIPPIADATIGADIWFEALYRYFGELVATSSEVLLNLTTEATASAGLDLFFDVSVILDLASFDAHALPNFGVGMPIVVKNNVVDADASKPCFEFLIDVAWQVKVGWCPLCVKAGATTNLFDVAEPDNCNVASAGTQAVLAESTVPAMPATDRTSIAVDGLGAAMVIWGDESGRINVQSLHNGVPALLEQLPAGPGAMAPAAAYLDTDAAVMVWAQSALSATDFKALDGDPDDELDGDVTSALTQQHLVYRVHDGTGWSETQALTSPGGGDGGVVLAACPDLDPACPAGGEVLAVWVHDASGNYNLHDMKLRFAFFDGLNWTPPAELDPASTAKDIQPAATYLNGDPVVFWVRNPSVANDGINASFDLNQRRIAYRFLRQSAGVKLPQSLPTGVASPSVQAFGDNALALAFSVATEADAFIGSRRSLHTAFATQCFSGTCSIGSGTERTDGQGRRIFVERPKLARNASGQGVITFRQLGNDDPAPGDPFGVLTHTGQIMQLIFEFDPVAPDPVGDPFSLMSDDTLNVHMDAVFDPAANAMLTSAVQVEQTTPTTRALDTVRALSKRSKADRPANLHGVSANRLADSPVVLAERPMLPDFDLVDARLDSAWIEPGASASLSATIRNNGPAWSEDQDLTLATYWDGPPGLGLPGPTLAISELGISRPSTFAMEVPLPDGFNSDDEHLLYVVVNPQGLLTESDAANNSHAIQIGKLPVPDGLTVVDGIATGTVVVHWQPADDPRVTGYRVYRRNPDDSVLIVGSSPVGGFADFSAYPDQRYEYFVTSHSARLIESDPSNAVPALVFDADLMFSDSFE